MRTLRIDPIWFQEVVDASPQRNADSIYDPVALSAGIDALGADAGDLDARDIHALETHFILRMEVDGVATRTYADVARRLADHLPNGRSPIATTRVDVWAAAVASAIALNAAQPDRGDASHYASLHELAREAKKLREFGVSVKLVGTEFDLDPASEQFCRELDEDVRRYGGIEFAEATFQRLSRAYDVAQGRYRLGRRAPQIPSENPRAALPIGYLLNLAVKHPEIPMVQVPNRKRFLESIEERATALTACLKVQPYTSFEYLFADGRALPRMLQRIAVYDSAFTLFQLRPRDMQRILRGVFGWVDEADMKSRLGYSLSEAIAAAEIILALGAQRPHRPLSFRKEQVQDSGLDGNTVDAILRDFTHSPVANSAFFHPSDSDKVDFWFRPLVRRGTSYVLVNPSWCAPAFYEAISAALGTLDGRSRAQERIGKATEGLVRQELAAHGVLLRSGTYNAAGKQFECDGFVETDKEVIFIEAKAKGLTRESRAGSDVKLLMDLTSSLLMAQLQLGRHELFLRQSGKLDLTEVDGSLYRLELRGRQINRVALTLLDFGGVQNSVILGHVMRVLAATRYGVVDPAKTEQFELVAERSVELREQIEDLAKLDTHLVQKMFLTCWFVSVPYLLVILDDVRDPASFRDAFGATQHISMGTLDPYFEYAKFKNIHAQAVQRTGSE